MEFKNVKDLKIEQLKDISVTELIEKSQAILSKIQDNWYALAVTEDSDELVEQKVGSVLLLAVVSKIAAGKNIQDFDENDWKEIAERVSDIAVLSEGSKYSKFIFDMYSKYIEHSADFLLKMKKSPEFVTADIKRISKEICDSGEAFDKGEIKEVAYVESCMWLSLEGMIKLLSAWISAASGDDYIQLMQARAMLVFEYARFRLYDREQAILTEYLENQYKLDVTLQEKYQAFIADLDAETAEFDALIDNAFTPAFRGDLRRTADFARSVGVPEEEIFKSIEDVDDFFLN